MTSQGKKILVVDDSSTMRQLIKMMLAKHASCNISEAVDGQDAFEKINGSSFDLILTDINMPMMDGLKLVSMVRRDEVHKDIPIVIITTEGAQEDRQRALSLGANAYITKPIQAPQVINTVKGLLGID